MDATVGIGEMKLSADKSDTLITYSLGTCLGLTIYDPVAGVAGMIHCQLPLSNINTEKASVKPAMFIDTGVPKLFEAAYALGGQKKRMIVKIAGCNSGGTSEQVFRIGERNHIMIRKLLWKNGVFISGEDIGGTLSRTMSINIAAGDVTIKSGGTTKQI